MKEAQRSYAQIVDDPHRVRRYVASSIRRERGIGRIIAKRLSAHGFERGRVLDAGIGSGKVAVELAQTFAQAEVFGLDLSRSFLELAQGYLKREGTSDRAFLK